MLKEDQKVTLPWLSTDSNRVWRTHRDFRYYTELFNYGTHGERLRGKKILDLGAGNSNFAQEANKIPETKVIQLDASYTEYPPSDTRDKICAAIQELPFRDGTFDEVIASHSVMYIPEMDIEQSLKEMLRVTKDEGLIKIFPSMYNGHCSPNIDTVELHPNARLTRPDSDPDFFTLEIKKEDSDEDVRDMIGILIAQVTLSPQRCLLSWKSILQEYYNYKNTL